MKILLSENNIEEIIKNRELQPIDEIRARYLGEEYVVQQEDQKEEHQVFEEQMTKKYLSQIEDQIENEISKSVKDQNISFEIVKDIIMQYAGWVPQVINIEDKLSDKMYKRADRIVSKAYHFAAKLTKDDDYKQVANNWTAYFTSNEK